MRFKLRFLLTLCLILVESLSGLYPRLSAQAADRQLTPLQVPLSGGNTLALLNRIPLSAPSD